MSILEGILNIELDESLNKQIIHGHKSPCHSLPDKVQKLFQIGSVTSQINSNSGIVTACFS